MGLDESGGGFTKFATYTVVITPHDGIPSSYKRVLRQPFAENGFLELQLEERTVFVNLRDVVSYSVRKVEAGQQTPDTLRKLPIKYEPHRPDVPDHRLSNPADLRKGDPDMRAAMTPADDFPGGESA